MPITDNFSLVSLSQIQIKRDERQRRKVVTAALVQSIRRNGLINPIVLTEDFVLVSGECRLEACRALGWESIPARFTRDLSSVELQIIELDENFKRTDLDWQDQMAAVARIHSLFLSLDPEWTQAETGDALGIQQASISLYLRVAQDWEADRRLQAAGTVREAYNILVRKDQRRAGEELEAMLELDIPADSQPELPLSIPPDLAKPSAQLFQTLQAGVYDLARMDPQPTRYQAAAARESSPLILCQDFLQFAPAYSGPKFNFLHCDFPYGLAGLFQGKQGLGAEPTQGYEDNPQIFFSLLSCLCTNLDKLMSISGHLMFWYSGKHEMAIRQTIGREAPSLRLTSYPLVWIKSDNAGIAGDWRREPRHVYETALLAHRGDRQLVRIAADAYSGPTDKRLHPSAKPEPMLRHFFSMLVDEGTRMFDPTAGSGSSLRAADSLGAASVLGLEIDPEFARVAERETRNRRALREATG